MNSSAVISCCLPPTPAPGKTSIPDLEKKSNTRIGRRDLVLRSSELATVAALFNLSGTKASYLGVQKSPPSLALCPATNSCVSTSEKISDSNHYAPPWNYNPKDGPRGKSISQDEAIEELIEVVMNSKPDKFSPRVAEKHTTILHGYLLMDVHCSVVQFVDDVEFWFPPGKKSILEYRSASRSRFKDFDINKKRVKALRLALEKKGWASESSF
ncbi:unnamed protein product [Alopecurus aequalis]